MVRALDSRSSGPGSGPGQGHCVVFLGKKWVSVNLMLGLTLQWTSIPSRGELEILLVASCYSNRR